MKTKMAVHQRKERNLPNVNLLCACALLRLTFASFRSFRCLTKVARVPWICWWHPNLGRLLETPTPNKIADLRVGVDHDRFAGKHQESFHRPRTTIRPIHRPPPF